MFGAREAAWPQIRDDLGLSYIQIGILLSVPGVVSNVLEPALGLVADTRFRATVLIFSGVAFTAAIALTAAAGGFVALLAAMLLMYPASGGFVSLAQANYMDAEPGRRDQNMARWVVAGSVGALAGSALIGAMVAGNYGWRPVFVGGAALSGALTFGSILLMRRPGPGSGSAPAGIWSIARDAAKSVRRKPVLRWLLLLQLSDLLGDIFLGYLAIYLVDVSGTGSGVAALGVMLWIAAGLVAGIVLVPLLGRVDGIAYVRLTAMATLVFLPVFLLVPGAWPGLLAVTALGFVAGGWYPVLQARLYAELPGRSGTAMALTTVFGPIGTVMPFAIGAAAAVFGLNWAMWIVMAAPLSLLLLTPRGRANQDKTARQIAASRERP